jgi:hypothetical protein
MTVIYESAVGAVALQSQLFERGKKFGLLVSDFLD